MTSLSDNKKQEHKQNINLGVKIIKTELDFERRSMKNNSNTKSYTPLVYIYANSTKFELLVIKVKHIERIT